MASPRAMAVSEMTHQIPTLPQRDAPTRPANAQDGDPGGGQHRSDRVSGSPQSPLQDDLAHMRAVRPRRCEGTCALEDHRGSLVKRAANRSGIQISRCRHHASDVQNPVAIHRRVRRGRRPGAGFCPTIAAVAAANPTPIMYSQLSTRCPMPRQRARRPELRRAPRHEDVDQAEDDPRRRGGDQYGRSPRSLCGRIRRCAALPSHTSQTPSARLRRESNGGGWRRPRSRSRGKGPSPRMSAGSRNSVTAT